MSFAFKFLLGGALGGAVTVLYRQQIQETSSKLHDDLWAISKQVTDLSHVGSDSSPASYPPPIPTRVPFTESLKAQWNEKLAYGLQALQTTDWTQVAQSTFAQASEAVSALQGKVGAEAGSAGAPIEAGVPQTPPKQV